MVIPLSKLLGSSLIAPIQQHMQLAEEAVQSLCQLLAASSDGEWDRAAEIHDAMEASVAASRALRRDIRRQLPRGLLLAMPRPDLLTLVDIQNRIAGDTLELARLICLRQMRFTPALFKTLDRFCSLLAAAAGQSLSATRELDEMLAQGFGKRESKRMEKMLSTLDKQVSRCDAQYQRLFRQLCKLESSLSAVDAMFTFQIAATLDRLAKACGSVGEQLELLSAS